MIPEIPAIVKAIEKAADDLVEMLKEAERQAEIRRKEWEVAEERHRQEEDRRQIQQSVQDSQTHLRQIIQAWGKIIDVEHFLQGVQERASELPAEERSAVLKRLDLARDFIGSQNPLDLFLSWKTPLERYRPVYAWPEDGRIPADDDSGGEDHPPASPKAKPLPPEAMPLFDNEYPIG